MCGGGERRLEGAEYMGIAVVGGHAIGWADGDEREWYCRWLGGMCGADVSRTSRWGGDSSRLAIGLRILREGGGWWVCG